MPSAPVIENKRVYICSYVALWASLTIMAASPMRAEVPAGAPRPGSASAQLVVRVDQRTGRLVRTAAAPKNAAPPSKQKRQFAPLVEQAAKAHNLDPLLVDSVIQVESNYNPYAVSSKGAEGLMQLMPATARMLGVSNAFDPEQNIEAGVRYLKQLKDQFKDDRLALAAYNAGPAAVDKYKWIPPYTETQDYVSKIGQRYGDAKRAAEAAAPAGVRPAAAPAKQEAGKLEEHPRLEQFVDEDGRLHLSTKRP